MSIAGVLGRAIWWNVVVGALTAFVTGIVIAVAMTSEDPTLDAAYTVPFFALSVGVAYGVAAGIVHGIAQLPLLLRKPRRARRAARVLATAVSGGLVAALLASQASAETPYSWEIVAIFAPYVLLTPFLAAWGYVDASTDAAESAALRNGASTASRVDSSASESSRATSA